MLLVQLAVRAQHMADLHAFQPVPAQQGAQGGLVRGAATGPAQMQVQYPDMRQLRVQQSQDRQHRQGGDRADQGQLQHADAEQDPDGRGHPEGRRRGQPLDRKPLAKDHPRTQEADAGQQTVRHPRRVDDHILSRQGGEGPLALVHGRQHQQARGHTDQDMGAEPGRMAVIGPFDPDQPAGRHRRQHRPDQLRINHEFAPATDELANWNGSTDRARRYPRIAGDSCAGSR